MFKLGDEERKNSLCLSGVRILLHQVVWKVSFLRCLEQYGGREEKVATKTLGPAMVYKPLPMWVEEDLKRLSTGFEQMDLALGGGLVKGQVLLIAGEPGIGKSTLLCSWRKNTQRLTERCCMYREKSQAVR